MIKTKAINHGICCESCQEDVNVHRCEKCLLPFGDEDVIYCVSHSQTDSEHYHEECKPPTQPKEE